MERLQERESKEEGMTNWLEEWESFSMLLWIVVIVSFLCIVPKDLLKDEMMHLKGFILQSNKTKKTTLMFFKTDAQESFRTNSPTSWV